MLASDISQPPAEMASMLAVVGLRLQCKVMFMSPASTKTSMLAVAGLAPLRSTVLAVANYTRQHANLLVPEQIVSGLVNSS
jgi:hypothetical protein